MDVDCSGFNICCICPTAPRPIQIDCDLASDIEMTLFLYSCGVTIGDSPQDTLVCDVDGVPRVPCKFLVL